jgi:predicted ester cyclase
MVKTWHAAMPDGHMTIDDIVTEGELSTIRMTWEATHTGAFGDIPASGKHIKVTSTGIDRVVNGKITEGWGELDMLGMLQQMGAIPAPVSQPAAAKSQPPDPEAARVARNTEIIHRFYRALNNKQRDVFSEIVHSNFVHHGGASGDFVGPKALADSLEPLYAAMPDWHISEEYIVAQGDRVAVRGTISGTHLGSFMGAAPTGKKVSWTALFIYRLDDEGKIIERWQDLDGITMLQQLGVIPANG